MDARRRKVFHRVAGDKPGKPAKKARKALDLAKLSYRQLQGRAKKAGIPANLKTEELIAALS